MWVFKWPYLCLADGPLRVVCSHWAENWLLTVRVHDWEFSLLPIWPSCPDSPSAEGLTAYCSPSYPLSAHSCLSSQLNFLLSQAMCVKQKQQVSYILTMSHVTLINKLGNEEWSRWNKYLGWGKLLENGITSKVRGMQRAGFHKGLIWVWYKTMLHVWPDDKVSYWTCT